MPHRTWPEVFDDLLSAGFVDEDGYMTTGAECGSMVALRKWFRLSTQTGRRDSLLGMQPYNFLAHIISDELLQQGSVARAWPASEAQVRG